MMRLWSSIVLVVAIVSATLIGLYFTHFQPRDGLWEHSDEPVRVSSPLTKKLLIVCVDGARRDALEDPIDAPFFAELRRRGVGGSLEVPTPTLTGMSVLAFGTGTEPPLGDAMNNFVLPRWKGEDVFRLARSTGHRIVFYGDDTWHQAFGEKGDPHDVFSLKGFGRTLEGVWNRGDRKVLATLQTKMTQDDWDIMVLHLSSVDITAHRHGAARASRAEPSPYHRAIRNIDEAIANLSRLAGDDCTVVYFSDHGCTDAGTHGGFDDTSRIAAWAAAGPGIPSEKSAVSLRAQELAPLWCGILGLRAPCEGRGILQEKITTHSPVERSQLIAAQLRARGVSAASANEEIGETVLRAAHEESEEQTKAQIAQQRSSDEFGWTLLVGLLSLSLVFLWVQDRQSLHWHTGLVIALASLALTFVVALTKNYWVYYLMRVPRIGWTLHPVIPAVSFFILGVVLGKLTQRLRPRRRAFHTMIWPMSFALLGYAIIAWSYGPQPQFFSALFIAAMGAAATQKSTPKSSVSYALAAGVAALIFALGNAWYVDSVSIIYRVSNDTISMLMGAASLFTAVIALSLFARSSARAWTFVLFSLGLAIGISALSFASQWQQAPLIAWSALALFVFAATRGVRNGGAEGLSALLMAVLALAPLFMNGANLLMLGLFALCNLALATALRSQGHRPHPCVVLLFLVGETFYFFAQGYQYRLTTFDMNAAFVFWDGDVNEGLAFFALCLQQAIPLLVALISLRLSFPRIELDRIQARRLIQHVAVYYGLRLGLAFIVLPFFRSSGWHFLYTAHFLLFEGIEVLMILATFPLLLRTNSKELLLSGSPTH